MVKSNPSMTDKTQEELTEQIKQFLDWQEKEIVNGLKVSIALNESTREVRKRDKLFRTQATSQAPRYSKPSSSE